MGQPPRHRIERLGDLVDERRGIVLDERRARHKGHPCFEWVLHEHDATDPPYRHCSCGSILASAREHHAHDAPTEMRGRLEERIDRGARRVTLRPLDNAQTIPRDHKVSIGRSDVRAPPFQSHVAGRLADDYRGVAA